jgi:endonuclease YncB( thermonuclease family)
MRGSLLAPILALLARCTTLVSSTNEPGSGNRQPHRRPRLLVAAMFVIAALAVALPARSEELRGKVVAIADGDTITVLTDGKTQRKVRLAEIDTPESQQPYGSRSRQTLADLVFAKEVQVEVTDTDRYGRSVGRVHAGAQDVNAEMVRQGAAWVYRQYSHDPSLLALEQEAQAAKRGLWALPEAERMPPWEWRVAAREGRGQQLAAASSKQVGQEGFACAGKRTCGAMTSCAEARFYLEQCGVTRLDGDHDGVPCEKLCR